MENTDAKLIQRAQAGDKQAVSMLYQQSYEDIYNYIFYRVSDPQAAQDLSSEVFIRMLRKLPEYQDRGKPLLAWLYTIARHLVIDHYRSRERRREQPLPEQPLTDLRAGPAQQLQQDQQGQCFRQALRHLTPEQQDVIIHRFVEERSTAETAELVEKSTRAVRSLQHRALRSLEKALTKEECV